MCYKYSGFVTFISFILIMIAISFSLSACGNRDAEIQALQQQVKMLATQNALLAESKQESTSAEVADEVVAPPPPIVDQDVQVEFFEPTPERLPDTPLPAGTTVIYDGWALTMSNDIKIVKDQIYLTFTVRNISDNTRVFRFIKSGVKLLDNQGNQFPMKTWNSCLDDFNITHQFSLNAGSSQKIYSSPYTSCGYAHVLSSFEGTINHNASYLVIKIDDWGPFSGIVFHMDL